MIGLVDYGLGNIGSVANMFRRVGATATRVSTRDELLSSNRLVLPGVGSFDAGVAKLKDSLLFDAVGEFAASGRPLLGICLGMQLLMNGSDEGGLSGLGLLAGRSVRFDDSDGLRVPHMGWNSAAPVREDPLVADLPPESRYYFVHSFHVVPDDEATTLAVTDYGTPFTSMVRRGNVMGAQFHPEKSHTFGMAIMRNFAAL